LAEAAAEGFAADPAFDFAAHLAVMLQSGATSAAA
jgi:hypothetical protein